MKWLPVLLLLVPQETAKPQPWKLSIEPATKIFRPGEPMMLKFTIENTTDAEAELAEPADYAEGLEIWYAEKILRPAEKTKDIKRRWKVDGRGFIGRSVDISKLLKWEEGFYTFKWQFGDVWSNEVRVLVIPDYLATIETNYSNITIEFYPDSAPYHVMNFVKLAREGKYTDSRFHRIIPGFMMQGGIMKDPPKPLKAEFNDRKHLFGTVSMARTEDPDSATCSFFICFADSPHLDGKYTVFGNVVDGKDVVKEIETVKTDHNPCKGCKQQLPAKMTQHCGAHHEDRPVTDVVIKRITITVRKK